MPRSARILPPSGFFHIITRGNNRQDVFHKAEDFLKYKSILWEVRKEHEYRLCHYCLMTNHVHLLLETVEGESLPVIMKKINLRYAQYYRKKYHYHGHFWQDRYKSLLIGRDSYLLECAAYIELNPVGEEWFLKALEEKIAVTIHRRKRGRPRKELVRK